MVPHTITPAVGAVCRCKANRIVAFTLGSRQINTIVIIAEIESAFVTKDDLVPFRCSPGSPHAWLHSQRRHRWVCNKGSTCNGHHDPKCPSARRLYMARKDTGAPNEGATCAWMVHFIRVVVISTTDMSRASLDRSSRKLYLSDPLVPTPPYNTIRVA
ncbi:hypothetical protein TNCV_1601061 [Trichonephila clavipes]|nr:hypothetical protein TNCV_1601061 [Trichonephila clavipes]